MATSFPHTNHPAAEWPLPAAIAPDHLQLPESEAAAAAALRGELDIWVNEPGIGAETHEGRVIARDRILDWQRVNIGLLPHQVARLDLSSLNLRRVPAALARLTNLTVVDLDDNGLTELPPAFWGMANLEVLYLSRNPLGTLRGDIGRLDRLRTLQLRSCGLRELPEEFGNLANLQVLNVTGNPITQLPASFSQLQNLQTFAASHTGLDAQAIDLARMPNLQTFGLGMQGAEQVSPLPQRVPAGEPGRPVVAPHLAQAGVARYRAGTGAGEDARTRARAQGEHQRLRQVLGQVLATGNGAAPVIDPYLEARRLMDEALAGGAQLRPFVEAQQNPAAEIGGGIAMPAGGAGSARQLRGGAQATNVVPRAIEIPHHEPAAPLGDPAVAQRQIINGWHERLLAFAMRSQQPGVRLELTLAASELVLQMDSDADLAAKCAQLALYAGDSDTGLLIALNEMHEAAMVARCEHPDTDARTLIGLGTDLFVLGKVKEAAVAAAALERVAGLHDRALAIMLARQSGLCVKLEMFDIRAPLPTRSVDFHRMDVPPEGQMDRELQLLQMLQDGTALRQHLASWPVLGRHVEAAHADEFAQLWGQLQPLMADLEEYADSARIGEGTYLALANDVRAKVGEQAAVLRQGKVNEVLQSILDVRQEEPAPSVPANFAGRNNLDVPELASSALRTRDAPSTFIPNTRR